MDIVLEFLLQGLQISAPIAFAALGGVFSEKSGVVNIALEGIMLTTTFAIVWGALATGSFLGGLLFAIVAGLVMSGLHALVTVTFKVDQIVSGVAINLLAVGVGRFLSQNIYGQ